MTVAAKTHHCAASKQSQTKVLLTRHWLFPWCPILSRTWTAAQWHSFQMIVALQQKVTKLSWNK